MTERKIQKMDWVLNMEDSGYQQKSGLAYGFYRWISVINSTDNKIEIYAGIVTPETKQSAELVGSIPYYTAMTMPLPANAGYTFIYTSGGVAGQKQARIYFSDESLNIFGQLGSPAANGDVSILSDQVGLARQAQLPATLTAEGYLKTSIEKSVDVELVPGQSIGVNNFPATQTVAGTITANTGTTRTAGTHANAWNAAAVSANGTSSPLDAQYTPYVSAFGNVSGATNITIQISQDGTNYYDTDMVINLAGAGNFGKCFSCGSRYVRLKSSAAVTITATLGAKQ